MKKPHERILLGSFMSFSNSWLFDFEKVRNSAQDVPSRAAIRTMASRR